MSRRLILSASLVLALASTGATVQAQPKPNTSQCFLTRDWEGWRPSPDSKSMYLRVGVKQVFRLDFSSACETLQRPNAHLISKVRGGSWICSPLDLDLQVSDGPGSAVPCIVRGMTRLTPDQVAALPKDLRP